MIRQALPEDAPQIAPLIILAMDDLAAKFIGGTNPVEAIPLFDRFVRLPGNQYSYENTLVYEDGTGICGMINAYDGAMLEQLRGPFLRYISSAYGLTLKPENETGKGEYYIDCVSVSAASQGKGIGKKLIQALIEKAGTIDQATVGLLVSKENPKAEKLYAGLGFKVTEEIAFMGGHYLHMQCATTFKKQTSNT